MPTIDTALVFPEIEEPFNLPARSDQHQNLLHGEQATRHIREQDAPPTKSEQFLVRFSPQAVSHLQQPRASKLSHLFRNPFHDQSHRQPTCLGEDHSQFHSFPHLVGQETTQLNPMAPA